MQHELPCVPKYALLSSPVTLAYTSSITSHASTLYPKNAWYVVYPHIVYSSDISYGCIGQRSCSLQIPKAILYHMLYLIGGVWYRKGLFELLLLINLIYFTSQTFSLKADPSPHLKRPRLQPGTVCVRRSYTSAIGINTAHL